MIAIKFLKCLGAATLSLVFAGNYTAAHAQSGDALALTQAVYDACPTMWEDIRTEIDFGLATGDIWENDSDGIQDFMDFLDNAMGDDAPDAAGLLLMASDKLTVATECATQRTALMQYLIEAMPNDILVAMESVGAGFSYNIGSAVGLSAENPAESCLDVKERYPDSIDGAYWIDTTASVDDDAYEVYCDMTTSGGGWTLVAFVKDQNDSGPNYPANFWTDAINPELNTGSNAAASAIWSLGIVPVLLDTEMMLTLDSPDPATAESNSKIVQFKYAYSSAAFNSGPAPCTPGSFEYRTNTSGVYEVGELVSGTGPSSCSDEWKPENSSGSTLTSFKMDNRGMKWNSAMGGNNSWKHDAWFYIR